MTAVQQALLMHGQPSGAPILAAAANEEFVTAASHSPAVPAHNVGDLIVVHVHYQGSPGLGSFTINKSFTISSQTNPASTRNTGCAWKIADGDDSFTLTPGASSADLATRIEIFSRVWPTAPFEKTAIAAGATPADITPSWGAGKNTYFGFAAMISSSATAASFSANYPDEQVYFQSDVGDLGHMAYRSNTDTVSLSGIVTFTSGAQPASYRYAIRGWP